MQILKRYPGPPIAVVVAINTTTQDILNLMEITNPDVIFASQPPSTFWAKSFHLLNAGTIRPYLAEPLDPLVAVAHFLIEQKQSLISMGLREDITIQMLFRFAKEIFRGDIGKYDNIVDTLQYVCTQSRQQLLEVRSALVEDVKSSNTRKRTTKMLENSILFVDQICRKHCLSVEPSTTAIPSSTPSSSPVSSPTPSTSHDVLPILQHENPTWLFVDAWKRHLGDSMD